VRVKLINYIDLKKKLIQRTVEAEQWRHASTIKKKKQNKTKLFSEQWTQFGRAESSKLLLSISLRLPRNKLGDPCTVNSFFS